MVIFHFQLKERKLKKCNKLVCNINDSENCCSHNSFKTSIKLWINTLKSTQSSLTNQKSLLKHGSNRLVTTDERRNPLDSDPNYNATKYFS